MASNGINIRELIMDMLISLEDSRQQSHLLLKNVLDKYDYLPIADKSFIKRVFSGTLEYRIKLDYIIDCFSKTPVKKMKPVIRNIMRMSVYQLIFMDKVPDSAACNEAVKLAGKRGFKGLQGFVNGVLRAVIRGKDNIKYPDINSENSEDIVYGLSVLYSCPEIIARSLIADYGREKVKAVLRASLENRNIYVRVDETLSKKEIDSILDEWQQEGIGYEKSSALDYAYKLSKADKLSKLKSFIDGLYTVQDLSSMFVCEMAGIKKGDTILDICAAPGGKSLHAANKLKLAATAAGGFGMDSNRVTAGDLVTDSNIAAGDFGTNSNRVTGKIISRDLSEYKISLIRENVERLKCENIELKAWDALSYDEALEEKADVVIVDVPCSGFGVMGRKPDIKYNITEEGLKSLVDLQRAIIDNAVRYVKTGGTLMYSTCTMRKAENEDNVQYILSKHDYSLIEEKQLFLSDEYDGFYIAKLRKTNKWT